jgi:hypothetical protein
MGTRLSRVVIILAIVASGVSQRLDAISPVIIMIYGAPMAKPVFITARRFFYGIERPTSLTVKDMGRRPYLKLAMFWGPTYEQYVNNPSLLGQLRPEEAGQHGRLYLPTRGESVVVLQTAVRGADIVRPSTTAVEDSSLSWGGTLQPTDENFLRRSGVPIDHYQSEAKSTHQLRTQGGSSFKMVPCPWAPAIVAFTGPLRFTKNVSFGSTVVSTTDMVIDCVNTPDANVSVPNAAL